MEAITAMFFLASKVYRTIKEIGIAEGIAKGREEGIAEGREIVRKRGREIGIAEGREIGRKIGMSIGREIGIAEGREIGRAEGISQGVDAAFEAMREAGVDDDARRQVEDILVRRAWQAWRNSGGGIYSRAG